MADQQKGKAWPVANATLTNQASHPRFSDGAFELIKHSVDFRPRSTGIAV